MRGRRTASGDDGTLGTPAGAANSHPAHAPLQPQAPRRQPSQRRSQDTVNVILEAATRVFEQLGASATTNQVAERAGVSIGSLYQYFPNKQALLTALHERHVEQVAQAVLTALDEPAAGDGLVERLVANCLAVHRRQPRLQRLLHQDLPQLAQPDHASPAKRQVAQRVQAWVATQCAALGIADAAVATRTLLTMSESLVHDTVLRDPSGEGDAQAAVEITRALNGYLHGRPR